MTELCEMNDCEERHRGTGACLPDCELHPPQRLAGLGVVDPICLTQFSYALVRPDWTEPTQSGKASLFVRCIFSAFVLPLSISRCRRYARRSLGLVTS